MDRDSVFWHSVVSSTKKGESSPSGGGVVRMGRCYLRDRL